MSQSCVLISLLIKVNYLLELLVEEMIDSLLVYILNLLRILKIKKFFAYDFLLQIT